jgi:predicted RNA binding protein YcfA (HicA-like mRNA interferase family)
MRIILRTAGGDAVETQTRRIVARLEREGWVRVHGGRHDKFVHSNRPDALIVVPRHREVSPGVARDIAKRAGWAF